MNLLIDLLIVLPKRIAFSIEANELFKMTMSLASLAVSVPSPTEKPTSAAFNAGASFTPSPVIPATRSSSCAHLTRRFLSIGNARLTTFSRGKMSLSSSSDNASSSSCVSVISSSEQMILASFAIAIAVSFLSPVTITT